MIDGYALLFGMHYLFTMTWPAALWRAAWQGGLAILLVWMLCRLWPAVPPRLRVWLWRLAYLKLLAAWVWAGAVTLSFLPSLPRLPVHAVLPPLPAIAVHQPAPAVSPTVSTEKPAAKSSPEPAPSAATSQPPASSAPAQPAAHRRHPADLLPLLGALWVLGIVWGIIRLLLAMRLVHGLRREGRPVSEETLLRLRVQMVRQMGLRKAPMLLTHPTAGPLLLGMVHPVIIVPQGMLAGNEEELQLALAHELAHVRRRDIFWGWLPALVEILFFFHPLVYLARREYRLAQEIATDAQALERTGAAPQAYGAMLVNGAAVQAGYRSVPVAVGIAESGSNSVAGSTAFIIWDLATGKEITRLAGVNENTGFNTAFIHDGSRLAIAERQSVGIWNTRTGQKVKTLDCKVQLNMQPVGMAKQLLFSPNGRWLAAAGRPGRSNNIAVWDYAGDGPARILTEDEADPAGFAVNGIAFTPDSAELIYCGASFQNDTIDFRYPGVIRCWNLDAGKLSRTITAPLMEHCIFTSSSSPDGRYLALRDYGNAISLWDLTEGRLLREIRLPDGWAGQIAMSPDGRRLLGIVPVEQAGEAHIMSWNTATGTLLHDVPTGQQGGNIAISISPDGKWAATYGFRKGTVKIWNTEDWTLARQFDAPGMVLNVLFSPDGRSASWAVNDQRANGQPPSITTLTFLNLATGTTTELRLEAVRRFMLSYTSDSRRILATDEILREPLHLENVIIDAQTGAPMAVLKSPEIRTQDPKIGFTSLWFGKEDDMVYGLYQNGYAGALDAGFLVSWDLATGEIKRKEKRFGTDISYRHLFDKNARCVVVLDSGAAQLYDMNQQLNHDQLLPFATLRWFNGGKWLITTPDGYYDCSPDLTKDLRWKFNGELYPYEHYEKQYHRPDMVRKALGR